ncbi:uncharacterized protein C8R40DRAFT_1235655 [Lentinula edodes]|uniref:uncharacterized protein n=1 Tax=Lentinula edodes TaxID=5353 RepID=UPI001E8D5F7E|nr:uncharacterized protein C8R40DRAFT_1235655 [Lentinula edodes]KAH7877438.1 hypothetical protein C8R40DRAFT_1235655 [Lentinula edodes]
MDTIEHSDFQKHAKLEAEYQTRFLRWSKLRTIVERWEQSQNHFPLDDARKAKLQSLKAQVEDAQKQLDAAHARRAENGNSSLTPLLTSVENQETKIQELQRLSNELDLKLVEAAALKKEAENKPLTSAERVVSNDADTETRPNSSKRRRTDAGYEDSAAASLARTKEEISGLHVTLREVLERVSIVENNIASQETEVREVMQAYHAQGEAGESSIVSPLEARTSHMQEQMDDIAMNLTELSEWIAELYIDNSSIDERHKDMIAKKEGEEAEIRVLLARVEEHEKSRAKDRNEIETLSAALTAYYEKPVSPPSSPFDPETVVLDMEEQIKELVRNAIKPHVEETRTTLSEDLQKYDSELYRSLWKKLSMTNQVIAAVSEATTRPPT